MNAPTPATRERLAMLLPRTTPKERREELEKAEIVETESSGKDVPNVRITADSLKAVFPLNLDSLLIPTRTISVDLIRINEKKISPINKIIIIYFLTETFVTSIIINIIRDATKINTQCSRLNVARERKARVFSKKKGAIWRNKPTKTAKFNQ